MFNAPHRRSRRPYPVLNDPNLLPGWCLLLWLLVTVLLTACAAAGTPTRLPVANVPSIPTVSPTAPVVFFKSEARPGSGVIVPQPVVPEPSPFPTPAGEAVRPNDAKQYFVPDAGPQIPEGNEWRPPPLPVPLSIHPDDHYWFVRPIPSGSRNYFTEWYPFGNDVLISDLAPYRIHHGVDFPNEQGTPVLAAARGEIIHAGPLPSPRDGVNYYGNTVIIRHDWQWQEHDVFTLYAHTLELFVEAGDIVQQGQLIAGVGSSGEVSGPHLHFEVRIGENNYGSANNPALWLVPYEGWGTLAGRLVDERGLMITGADVAVRSLNGGGTTIRQRTYELRGMQSDEVWRENFVVGDLPAGRYQLDIDVGGIAFQRRVEVLPGRTTFEVISTNFQFEPTITPVPTDTATPTPSPTATREPVEATEATPAP